MTIKYANFRRRYIDADYAHMDTGLRPVLDLGVFLREGFLLLRRGHCGVPEGKLHFWMINKNKISKSSVGNVTPRATPKSNTGSDESKEKVDSEFKREEYGNSFQIFKKK